MLLAIFCITGFIIFIVMPVLSIMRYYAPRKHSLLSNLFWFVVTILTWPLTAVVLASCHKDTKLSLLFWIPFMIWLAAGGFWVVNNFSQYIENQSEYINTLGTGI